MYNVMIVDDEPVPHEYLRSLILWEQHGFLLLPPVYSTKQARAMLRENHVDIVLLDVFMPDEDGVAFSGFLAEHYPGVAMLAVSSHDDYEYVRKLLKNGAHDYILKNQLTAGVLLQALQGIAEKLDGHLAPQSPSLRAKVLAWLQQRRLCPENFRGKRLAVAYAHLVFPPELTGTARSTMQEGILSVAESNRTESCEVTAVFYQPDCIAVIYAFSDSFSQNAMLGSIYLNTQKNQNNLRLLYRLTLTPARYPLFGSGEELPRFLTTQVQHTAFPGREEHRPMACLTLAHKKQLIAALQDRNADGACLVLRTVLGGLEEDDTGSRLSVTKDILDIFISALQENGIYPQMQLHEELNWANSHTSGELTAHLEDYCAKAIGQMQKKNPGYSAYTQSAVELIRSRCGGELGLEDAAAAIGITPSYLSRIFKKDTGSSFVEYMNKTRIDIAKSQLLAGVSIKETASLCGFRHYNYFIEVFKKYAGCTPAEICASSHI